MTQQASQLINKFQDFKPVHAAAFMGDLGCLKMLVEAGADLAAPSAEGFTALSAAFLNKNLNLKEQIKPVVEYLMANTDWGMYNIQMALY